MKFLAKLAVFILILGGILFAVGYAQGGHVYSVWYDGHLHSWQETRSIIFSDVVKLSGTFCHDIHEEIQDTIEDIQDTIEDIQDELADAIYD